MTTTINTSISYGDIFYAALPTINNSHVQQGTRPVLIISNERNNRHSPTVTIVPLTSQMAKRPLPTHVHLSGCGLTKESIVLAEQILTLDKSRLKEKVGTVMGEPNLVEKIRKAISIQLNIMFDMVAA